MPVCTSAWALDRSKSYFRVVVHALECESTRRQTNGHIHPHTHVRTLVRSAAYSGDKSASSGAGSTWGSATK